MIYIERWKIILIIAVCALGVLYSAPNFLGKPAANWLQLHTPAFFPNQTVNLGLDLRGGSHLLLEVATDSVIDEHMQSLVDQTRGELRKNKIGYTDLGLNNGAVHFHLTDATQSERANQVLHDMDPELSVASDASGYTVKMTDDKIRDRKRAAINQSIEIVRRRIDETGNA